MAQREGNLTDEDVAKFSREARETGLEQLHQHGDLNDEEFARLKRELRERDTA
jgi:hypothetical protein